MTSPNGCTTWAGLEDLPADAAPLHTPQQWCGYLAIATDVLWAATGRRWRGENVQAEAVLRAAPPRPGEGHDRWSYHRSWGQCTCYHGTGLLGPIWDLAATAHHEPAAVRLPHPDVTSVTAVSVDGQPFTRWRLDGPWLVRTDGRGWPECHDRSIVTYRHGHPPPAGGRMACVELAVELGKAASTDDEVTCRLPQRTRSVTRQGITFEILDPQDFLADGLVGIYSIDVWIRSVNPHGRKQAATVWSPDLARARSSR